MASKRRGLGRGLDALLTPKTEDSAKPAAERGVVRQVSVTELAPNRLQPRQSFDEEELGDLVDSVRSQGVIQPIVVTQRAPGRYAIVAGERRWRAAQRAGLREVPVVVREVRDDQQLLELALVENLQRSDLNAIDEARAFQALKEKFGLSQEEIAGRVGRGRATIANSLRLLRLPQDVRDLLESGQLSAGQARPLLALGAPAEMSRLAQKASEQKLSARAVEKLVSQLVRGGGEAKKPTAPTDVHVTAAEERLTQELRARAQIRKKRSGGGQIVLHFANEQELMRLFDHLVGRTDGSAEERA